MRAVKIHTNGRVTHQQDGVSVTEGSLLVSTWSVDQVTELGAVIKITHERKYGRPGATDVTWSVVRGDSRYGSTASTRRAARALIGA